MGKIVYLMGKSSSGKDTIFKELLKDGTIVSETIVPYTTRPIRAGEQNGVEYFFTDEAGFWAWQRQGRVVESRVYDTVYGLWRYFTVDDGQLQLDSTNYLMIGTLESYAAMKSYFGEKVMVPLLIEVEDGIRLQRALDRERQQESPKYGEMCRRFLADSEDFAEEKIQQSGIDRRFRNEDFRSCMQEITTYLQEIL